MAVATGTPATFKFTSVYGVKPGGVLDSVDEARAVLAALKEQLSRYQFL